MKVNRSEITNPRFLLFLKARGIQDGEDVEGREYVEWIQKKHGEFRRLKGLSKGMFEKPYTEEQMKEFEEFLAAGARVKKSSGDGI